MTELKVQIGCEPQPQFTARLGTNEVSCVKLSFVDPSWPFYFYFTNGNLAAIKDRPKVEFEIKKYLNGNPWMVPKAVNSETKLDQVVKGPDLTMQELVDRISKWAKVRSQPKGEDLNVLPAFLLVPPDFKKKRQAEIEAANLAEKFDPSKIRLGMTTNETQAVFGAPELRIKGMSNRWEHVYGRKLSPFAPAITPSVWISVVFQDGEATRIFSHDFFDKRLVNGVP